MSRARIVKMETIGMLTTAKGSPVTDHSRVRHSLMKKRTRIKKGSTKMKAVLQTMNFKRMMRITFSQVMKINNLIIKLILGRLLLRPSNRTDLHQEFMGSRSLNNSYNLLKV